MRESCWVLLTLRLNEEDSKDQESRDYGYKS